MRGELDCGRGGVRGGVSARYPPELLIDGEPPARGEGKGGGLRWSCGGGVTAGFGVVAAAVAGVYVGCSERT